MHTPERIEPAADGSPRTNLVVAVLAAAGISVALMQTLVIPLIPELPELLHAAPSDAAWAITATLLAGAVATPVVGRLGDMFGKRRMLLFSIALLITGSVIGAFSNSLTPMVVGRILQGAAAGVIPLGISLMRDTVPPERLGAATALMSASLGIGGALGLPAAALLADNFDWHALFWVSAAVGALVGVLVLSFVPHSTIRTGGRFDVPGAIGLSAALVSLLLAISKGGDWGWTSGTTLGLFGAAVVVLLVWGVYELRTSQPLVDLRTTARRQVLLTNLASIGIGFAMFAMSLVIPTLLQLPVATGYGLGRSMLTVGLVMAPSGLVMLVAAPLAARVARVRGFKLTLIIGAVIIAAGYGFAAVLMDAVWQLVVATCIIGAGVGFAYGSMPALVMAAVPVSETAAANSLSTLMRSLGTSVASAVGGAILANMVVALGPVSVPSQAGFRVVLSLAAGAALVGALIAGFIPRHTRPTPDAAIPADEADGIGTAEPAAAL
ncbi:MFS transporter [Cryptosporangium sp. NPDC051539]|uniref:MFS transporter n=1 Tax=Cryptosporangium sp. NPDC051539 TaxID=3363962 RepID=UPI003787F19C